MKVVSSKNIVHIIRRALNFVDPRLIGHGERVAYLVYRTLQWQGNTSQKELYNLAMTALLHDIGAYKTEDIDRMVEFESRNIWEHSIYGYLFLKNLSPLKKESEAILFHHMPYEDYKRIVTGVDEKQYSGLINLTDRVEILSLSKSLDECRQQLLLTRDTLFSPEWVDLFLAADQELSLLQRVQDGSFEKEFEEFMSGAVFTTEEKKQYLEMVAYSIDFRSEFMVLHTVTTVSMSRILAELMELDDLEREKVHYGALLHDVGKVATPIEILEKPGSLTLDEMAIMKMHVVISGEILGDYLDSDIRHIAVRHHEKLDGSGYPYGLTGEELTVSERIVAIADILSALIRKRSYKDAYSDAKTIEILEKMRDSNKICPVITNVALENYQKIMVYSQQYGQEILDLYQNIKQTYGEILEQITVSMKDSDHMVPLTLDINA